MYVFCKATMLVDILTKLVLVGCAIQWMMVPGIGVLLMTLGVRPEVCVPLFGVLPVWIIAKLLGAAYGGISVLTPDGMLFVFVGFVPIMLTQMLRCYIWSPTRIQYG